MSLPLKVLLISVACLLAACGSPAALPTPQVLAATPTPTPFQIPSETPQPGPSATPDPYEALTISALVARRYGGGEMLDLGILGTNA